MGAINAGGMYGLSRAIQDGNTNDRAEESFRTDQAVRTNQLKTQQEEAPFRKRALQLGVDKLEEDARRRPMIQQAEDGIRELQEATARLTMEEKIQARKDYFKAVQSKEKLSGGVRAFNASGDPQSLADAMAEVHPELKGVKAVRQPNGSITFGVEGGKQQVLPAKSKNSAGEEVSADDQFAMFATTMLDPVKGFQEKLAADLKLKGELAKKEADKDKALAVEGEKSDREAAKVKGRDDAAAAKVEGEKVKRLEAKVNKVGSEVNRQMKTKDLGGGFGFGYANDDDAAIAGAVGADAQATIRDSHKSGDEAVDVAEAVRQSADKNRVLIRSEKQKAVTAATNLVAKKIDPNDNKAVKAAMDAGDQDAKALYEAMRTAAGKFGRSILPYMTQQLPALKKK